MKIQIIQVPYDSGNRSIRMGRGPEHFVENGLPQALQSEGHEVSVETIEAPTEFRAEVQTQFALYRSVARQAAAAKQSGKFPLVLSGNCGATLGVIAGADTKRSGLIWFDTHGEFNTPETTTSGFLDGMGLAIATGLCWTRLAGSIPNFRPIAGSNILLVGGHDFDEGERERLEQAGVTVLDADAIAQKGIRSALDAVMPFPGGLEEAHVHLDLDVLNPTEAPANAFVTENVGLSVHELSEAINWIQGHLRITSTTIASFDPSFDTQGKTLNASVEVIKQMLDSKKMS